MPTQRTIFGEDEPVPPSGRWSLAEDSVLRDYWQVDPLPVLIKKLKRNFSSVYARASRLGLPLGCPAGHESSSASCARLGIDRATLKYIRHKYHVPAIYGINRVRVYSNISVLDEAFAKWMKTESVHGAARVRGVKCSELKERLLETGHELPKRWQSWRLESDEIDAALAGQAARKRVWPKKRAVK